MTTTPLTIAEARDQMRAGAITSVELTTRLVERAKALDHLGVYVTRFDEQALAAAEVADRELADGLDRGPLHGVPIGVKDIIAAAEGPTTANSLVLDPKWGAGRDAPVITRLRAAGAVITGKVTTMEFAYGAPDPAKPFPFPRNPWDDRTWPGGSSSGSGAGVAAGLFLGALGSDTGGSIRLPAAFCGVTGLMGSFGRVPNSGVAMLGWSLDRIGPLARSAEDCGLILQALAGHERTDPYCADRPVPDFLGEVGTPLTGLRIGVDRFSDFHPDRDPALDPALDAAIAALVGLGAEVTEVEVPLAAEMGIVDMATIGAEAFSYHLPDVRERWGDYCSQTRVLLAVGALISGADYLQAQRVRRIAQRELARLYRDVDVIITPTATHAGLPYDGDQPPPTDQIFRSACTQPWNPFGNPVMALPMGFTAEGMPLSFQVAARPFEEPTLIRVGAGYQQATDWHRRVPPMVADLDTNR